MSGAGRMDNTRLDFLERTGSVICRLPGNGTPRPWCVMTCGSEIDGAGETLRDAIDQAMENQEEQT